MEKTFHYETIAKAIQFIRSHQIEQPTLNQVGTSACCLTGPLCAIVGGIACGIKQL